MHYYAAVSIELCGAGMASLLRKELRPSLQIGGLGLIEGHRFVHAYSSPQQEFDRIFPARPELACVRLEPDILRSVRPTHPVWEPMIKLTRGFLCTCWVSVSTEDCIFLGIGDGARTVCIRHTCKGWVHLTRRKGRIRYGAEAAGLVDVDFPTVLRGDCANQQD